MMQMIFSGRYPNPLREVPVISSFIPAFDLSSDRLAFHCLHQAREYTFFMKQ
jgi:hypothetical protein